MHQTDIAIIGGGLAGLRAAQLHVAQGHATPWLLEARAHLGGRVASVDRDGQPLHEPMAQDGTASPGFDLGPTWYWPGHQPELARALQALGLASLVQPAQGDLLFESGQGTPQRLRIPAQETAMRLQGGMAALVQALRRPLDPGRVLTGWQVHRLSAGLQGVDIQATDAQGASLRLRAQRVLLALPPRLAVATLHFDPPLPEPLARSWRDTATWMAPHAKYLAVYDHGFWRDQELSGSASSARGPLAEVHDASAPGGAAALFGFVALSAAERQALGEDALCRLCRAQLVRLFGPGAAMPRAEFLQDWAREPFTASAADLQGRAAPTGVPASGASSGPWHGRLAGIASEWSPRFPGHVAGAFEAAALGLRHLAPEPPMNSHPAACAASKE
jgi:monoamine oxidase